MYIPSHTRFTKNKESNTFEKRYIVDGCIYKVIIPAEEWNTFINRKILRWFNQYESPMTTPFPYGTLVYETGVTEYMIDNMACEKCNKILKTFKNKCLHMEKCSYKKGELVKTEEEDPETNPRTIERNITNTNNNNQVYNIQNNIQIRNYGNENPKWLTTTLLHQVMDNVQKAIPTLMEKKHFNDDFPENKNLKISSTRDINKRLKIFTNGRWRVRDSKQTFYKVLLDIYDIMSDALTDDIDEEDEDIPGEIKTFQQSERFLRKIERIRPIWREFQDKVDDHNPQIMNDLWEDLKTLLLDRQLGIEQGFD